MSSVQGWSWDPTLYEGSAPFYAVGRVAYPAELAAAIATELELHGTERLLDVGCGPGSLTLLLAPYVAEAIGVDADVGMIDEAARLARAAGVDNVRWRRMLAEQLPGDLPEVDVVTFAQSFHWMDKARVLAGVRSLLRPGGAVVHVSAETHAGVETDEALPYPRPPREAMTALVRRYLGARRRAGQGVVPTDLPGDENDHYRAAGLTGPDRIEVPGAVVTRTADQVVASLYSLSSAAPHLFGSRLADFDAELRELVASAGPDGQFSERMREVAADVWRLG